MSLKTSLFCSQILRGSPPIRRVSGRKMLFSCWEACSLNLTGCAKSIRCIRSTPLGTATWLWGSLIQVKEIRPKRLSTRFSSGWKWSKSSERWGLKSIIKVLIWESECTPALSTEASSGLTSSATTFMEKMFQSQIRWKATGKKATSLLVKQRRKCWKETPNMN